jgi:hypothetical protein
MTGLRRMTVLLASGCVVALGIGSCSPATGFRFHGTYEATQSGFRAYVISQGTQKFGSDLSESAYALVQFCPLRRSSGNPVLATFRTNPDSWIQMECEDPPVPPSDWSAHTAPQLLAGLLAEASYQRLDTTEVSAIARAISGALAGPKGAILVGQTQQIRVVRADVVHGWRFGRDRPQEQWIRPSELPGCSGPRKRGQQRA